MREFTNIIILIQLSIYYFIESLLIGAVAFIAWHSAIHKFFPFDITYLNCVSIIWAYKLIRFDLFKFINNVNNNNTNNKKNG
jgi:hypothetical protein